jgi:hypothetical protein
LQKLQKLFFSCLQAFNTPPLLKNEKKYMRKIALFLLLNILTHYVFSQHYVNSTRSATKKMFTKYIHKEKYQATISETDSTLIFLLRDPKVQNLDIFLHFDYRGKCDSEIKTLSCDSCYQKYLDKILSNKYFSWTKVDSNSYFSDSRHRLILTTGHDNPFSFMIRRSLLTVSEYKQIIRNSKK